MGVNRKDVEVMKQALLGPRSIWTNSEGWTHPYEDLRERLILELGYDEFWDVQHQAFKELFAEAE
jgi:hypothetical protein